MNKTLLEVFDETFSRVKFDKRLADRLYRFQIGFVHKNREHMEFFGGNLLGVQTVRFTDRDTNELFNDILDVDYLSIKELIQDVPEINPDFKVSSDVLNLTMMYVIHRFLVTPSLNEAARTRAAVDAALVFFYRCMTSLLAHSFKYVADPKIAQAAYANLSNRYLIKQLGNWQEFFYYRANEFIGKESIHRNTLIKFDNDYDVVKAINDGQSRIRDTFKNLYSELVKAKDANAKISSSSSTVIDADGEEVIKDRTHSPDRYQSYLLSIISDEHSFIKEELAAIVIQVMPTMRESSFRTGLSWLSQHHSGKHKSLVEDFIHNVMIYSIEYLSENNIILRNSKDLAGMLSMLRNLYLSSRSSDDHLAKIREDGSVIVKEACGSLSEQISAAIRTGLILYICIRAFTKHHYHSH